MIDKEIPDRPTRPVGHDVEAAAALSGPPRFVEIGGSRCRELLASHDVGRVGWTSAHGPLVLPVSYAYTDGAVVFRTSPYGVLSELVRPTEVAFEVDELDQEHRTGWSVLVQGRARAVAEPAELTRLWTVDGVVPWASGIRNLFLSISVRSISGRQVQRG